MTLMMKMINKITLLIFCCLAQLCIGAEFEKPDLWNQEERHILHSFFQYLLNNTPAGYVLFGNKPLCEEGYPLPPAMGITGINREYIYFEEGLRLLNRLNLPNKKFIVHVFNDYSLGYKNIVFINRETFLKSVNDNLSLFRYILGPKVTPNSLLEESLKVEGDFFSAFKYHPVLIGILLGYGKDNALYYGRHEFINNYINDEEEFPLLPKKIRFNERPTTQIDWYKDEYKHLPSFGFNNLVEENENILKDFKNSTTIKKLKSPEIPYFGCLMNSTETDRLLDDYESTRSKISSVLKSPHLVDEVLSKLLEGNDVSVKESTPINEPSSTISITLGHLFAEEFKNEKEEEWIPAFIEGMKASENQSIKKISEKKFISSLLSSLHAKKDWLASANLEKASEYIQQLKDFNCIIPHKLYFRTLNKGEGKKFTFQSNFPTLHYDFKFFGNNGFSDTKSGTIEKADLEKCIPGIYLACQGMQAGEERLITIHPDLGYGESSNLEANLTIIATIKLIDFIDTDKKIKIPEFQDVPKNQIAEKYKKYSEAKKEEFFWKGYYLWDDLKGVKQYLNLSQIISSLHDERSDINGYDIYCLQHALFMKLIQ